MFSNYCPSCFDCLFGFNRDADGESSSVLYGMEWDPEGFKSYADEHGGVLQAYSALATSSSDDHDFILNGNLTNDIAEAQQIGRSSC